MLLYRAFLFMISSDAIFLDSLILMMKELVAETLENDNADYENMKNIIHHNWIEMKPEFITILSNTLNK